MAARFDRFAAIDWSGAKGARHKGIAIALCDNGTRAPPRLIAAPGPGGLWSRTDAALWVEREAATAPTLFGFDFSFAPPIVERGAYLPGEVGVPSDGPGFWAYVDGRCREEPDLGATGFLEVHHRRHFYFGATDGIKAAFMHLRRCEARYNAHGGGKPSTVYDAIGAAQVAKASFAGMRLLHRLHGRVPIWPFDGAKPPESGSIVVEIYTSIAARAGGRPRGRTKMRDAGTLDAALARVGSNPHDPLARYDDHATDAILTAAWLRSSASRDRAWAPAGLDARIAGTEGWTFGIE